ncbi:hypothetical protein ABZU32_19590 [Sphaerisporangium sp. NPDC005288]|uniref:hypothetical protein n=1 Tax=Sphaerisporangium sp. NPDC005288 TaxID=3155114 RepID=UPI0033BD2536
MQAGRIVAVRYQGRRGSGYLVAPRLVLTSAHVTPPIDGHVTVAAVAAQPECRGVVVWRGTAGGRDDAALIRVDATAWSSPAGSPPRWGRVVTDRPGIACTAWGFPAWVQRPGRPAETAQPAGTLNPGDRYVADRYVMSLATVPPAPTDAAESPWSGLSGAAMFCGRLLTGVITADLAGGRHAHLEAVPMYVLHQDRDFRRVLADHGRADFDLEPAEMYHLADLEPPVGESPTALLRARAHVADFRGRERLMGRLLDWSRQAGTAAWLLHGRGGQGKTRVAHELGRRLADRRWVTLWLRHDVPAESFDVLGDVAVPLLLIIDYAETRSEQLTAAIRALAQHRGDVPVRMLLLARGAGPWWDNLGREFEHLTLGALAEELTEVDESPAGRADAYRQAVSDYARALATMPDYRTYDWRPVADRLSAADQEHSGPVTALTLHVNALADLLDKCKPPAEPATTAIETVEEDRLLRHERHYWSRSARELRPPLSGTDLEDVLAIALLFGADDEATADLLLRHVPALRGRSGDPRDIRNWVRALYPPSDGRAWGGLEPDRLAERFIGGHLLITPDLLGDELLTAATPRQIGHLFTVCARVAHHPSFGGRLDGYLTDLVLRHSQLLHPGVLSHVDPYIMADALRSIPDEDARRLFGILRTQSGALHAMAPEERLSQMELTAHQNGDHRLAARFAEASPRRRPRTRWTFWHTPDMSQRVLTDSAPISALAMAHVEGSLVLLAGDEKGQVLAISAEGRPRPRSLHRHGRRVEYLRAVQLAGETHVVSIDPTGGVRVTALSGAGPSRAVQLPPSAYFVWQEMRILSFVAPTEDGAVLVAAWGQEVWVTRLDADSDLPAPRLLVRHPGRVTAMAHAIADGHIMVLSGCETGTVYRSDIPATQDRPGPPHTPPPRLLLDDDKDDDTDQVRAYAAQLGRPLTDHERHACLRRRIVAVAISVHPEVRTVAADLAGHIFVLADDRCGPRARPSLTADDGVSDLTLTVIGERPALLYVSGEGVLRTVYLDRDTDLDVSDVHSLGHGDWELAAVQKLDGDASAICVSWSGNDIRLVPIEAPADHVLRPARHEAQLTALAHVVSDGQVVLASAHTRTHAASVLVHRLGGTSRSPGMSMYRHVWSMMLGQTGDGIAVLLLRYQPESDPRGAVMMTAWRLRGSPQPEDFIEGIDYHWDRFASSIRPLTRRALRKLPHTVRAHHDVRLTLAGVNCFMWEGGREFEITVEEHNLYLTRLDGPPRPPAVLYSHDEPISRFLMLRLHSRNVLLVTGSSGRLVSVLRQDDSSPRVVLAHDRGTPHSVRLAELDGEVLAISADDQTGAIWVGWVSTRRPPLMIGRFDERVTDMLLVRGQSGAGVVVGGREGRLSLFGIAEADPPRPFTVMLGAPVSGLMQHDTTLLIGTGAGVVAMELPGLPPYRPASSAEDAPGDLPTEWTSVLDDHPLPPAGEEDRAPRAALSWLPWVAAAACLALACLATGITWLMPAGSYAAYVMWSDVFTPYRLRDVWLRHWTVLGALLTAACALNTDWEPLIRAAIAAPTAVVVIGMLSVETHAPQGHPLVRRGSPLAWGNAMVNAFRFPRLHSTEAQDRPWLGGFLASLLAALGWDVLCTGALLPVLSGIIGLLISRVFLGHLPMLHRRGVLLLGAVMGVLVPLPVVSAVAALLHLA